MVRRLQPPIDMQVLRLVTVHPILTHFTIGAIPLLLIAYALAYRRRSERWTFVGDAALVVTALITVATAAFGLVSNFVLEWPGGLGTWRWLHLGFGAGTAAILLAFAIARVRSRRRRGPVSGGGALLASVGLAAVVTFTGWLGGEVLVYRAGMAVTAAGQGALAPPMAAADQPPDDLEQAMHRLRADWGATQSTVAHMIVEEPAPERFARVARHADRMARVADQIAEGEVPGHEDEEPPEEGEGVAFAVPARLYASVEDHGGAGVEGASPDLLGPMASQLAGRARSVAQAARSEDINRLTGAVGRLSSACASCHDALRWGKAHEH